MGSQFFLESVRFSDSLSRNSRRISSTAVLTTRQACQWHAGKLPACMVVMGFKKSDRLGGPKTGTLPVAALMQGVTLKRVRDLYRSLPAQSQKLMISYSSLR